MIVQHNLSAMNANRNLSVTTGSLSKSTEKLSSGYRINRAGDDAAGLAISEKMRGQIRGLNQGSANAEDGISLIQTAEGALTESHSILQRMRELAVQASSDTNTDDDREQIQSEISQLTKEVDRIATTTEFNTKKLLDGSVKGASLAKDGTGKVEGTFANGNVSIKMSSVKFSDAAKTDVLRITVLQDSAGAGKLTSFSVSSLFGNSNVLAGTFAASKFVISGNVGKFTIQMENVQKLKAGDVITITIGQKETAGAAAAGKEALNLQIGSNAGQELSLGIKSMKAKDLNIVQIAGNPGEALDVTDQKKASLAIEAYDMAIKAVSTERAKMGATQNRLEHTIANLDTSSENLQSAESRIRDVDMAKEMTQYSKSNILMQAGQSMLAQANQSTQGVLSLLQ